MKKHGILRMFVAGIFLFTSCNNGDNSSTSKEDSDTVTTAKTGNTDGTMTSYTYMELKTNEPVSPSRDTVANTYLDIKTMKPLTFYYDPNTHDTFDSRGRIVNNALIKKNEEYSVDEGRINSSEDAINMRTHLGDTMP